MTALTLRLHLYTSFYLWAGCPVGLTSVNSELPIQNVLEDTTIFHSGGMAKRIQVSLGQGGEEAMHIYSGQHVNVRDLVLPGDAQ
jgi:hypothetical protein